MTAEIYNLWPELKWIENKELRDKTAKTWAIALERSVLSPDDLNRIPFTLLCGPDLKVSFMAHKRCVVHVARESGKKMNEFFDAFVSVDSIPKAKKFKEFFGNSLKERSIPSLISDAFKFAGIGGGVLLK